LIANRLVLELYEDLDGEAGEKENIGLWPCEPGTRSVCQKRHCPDEFASSEVQLTWGWA